MRDEEKKVPPTVSSHTVEGGGTGRRQTDHPSGAGDRDRTGDRELGKAAPSIALALGDKVRVDPEVHHSRAGQIGTVIELHPDALYPVRLRFEPDRTDYELGLRSCAFLFRLEELDVSPGHVWRNPARRSCAVGCGRVAELEHHGEHWCPSCVVGWLLSDEYLRKQPVAEYLRHARRQRLTDALLDGES